MFGLVKLKTLVFGILLVSPFVAMRGFQSHKSLAVSSDSQSIPESVSRIPVEVIAEGSAPKWVYVQIGNQAVPEPGMASLLALAAVLVVFRRQRE